MILEDGLNILLFLPIGLIFCFIQKHRTWRNVALFGFGLSVLIELMQLISKRGFCEFDDVFHNTIGCLLGYGHFLLLLKCKRKVEKFEELNNLRTKAIIICNPNNPTGICTHSYPNKEFKKLLWIKSNDE